MKDETGLMFENAMKNKLGSVLEKAVLEKYAFKTFVNTFFRSELIAGFYEDITVFSQAHKYILTLYREEMQEKNILVEFVDEVETEHLAPAYWIGYIFAEWYYQDGTTATEILDNYDFDAIYDSYDMLHTQSAKYAIDWIKKEFVK